mmetsp:Transcript_43454/g.131406  ORF Transcript_43454/g.131406 Transcript_43454/m.131406 type:complete len:218 (+) Transcript_43454:880-1533(+)
MSAILSFTSLKSANFWGGGGSGYWNGCAGGTSLPTQRVTGPMSRVTSLYHAWANAASNAAWSLANKPTNALYAGSCIRDTSLVSMPTPAKSPVAFLARHCQCPPGPLKASHSFSNSSLKYALSHWVGFGVHLNSKPLVKASLPLPVPQVPGQGLTGSSFGEGPGPLGHAPCVLPKAWPPPMRATVSLSFIAIRPKASRMSLAEPGASGKPIGPSGFK